MDRILNIDSISFSSIFLWTYLPHFDSRLIAANSRILCFSGLGAQISTYGRHFDLVSKTRARDLGRVRFAGPGHMFIVRKLHLAKASIKHRLSIAPLPPIIDSDLVADSQPYWYKHILYTWDKDVSKSLMFKQFCDNFID